MGTNDTSDIDRLLSRNISDETANQWSELLSRSSPVQYSRLLKRLLNEVYLPQAARSEKPNVSALASHLLLRELGVVCSQLFRLGSLASTITSDDRLSSEFELSHISKQFRLSDFQIAVIAIGLLSDPNTNKKLRDEAAREVSARFQMVLRQLTISAQSGELTPRDLAWLARNLLVVKQCTDAISPMQKFVFEYTIYRCFPSLLPKDVQDILICYNKSREHDDATKTLAQLFEETRGAATTTLTSTEQILLRKNITSKSPGVELHVEDVLKTLINSIDSVSTWNGEHLGRTIQKIIPTLDWTVVIQSLDSPDIEISTSEALKLLLDVFRGAIYQGRKELPIRLMWSEWSNARNQASLMRQLTIAPLSVFNFAEFGGPKVLSAEDFVAAPSALKNLAADLETSPWNSLEILQCSLRLLATDESAPEAKFFLEAAGKTTPELIFLGCVQLPRPWGAQQEQLCEKGCEVFFSGQPNHQLVFFRLWQVDPEFMCRKLVEYYSKDSLNISRILDIAHDLLILDQLLNLQPYSFAIDLAAIASRREILNIEKWLDHHLSAGQDIFIDACLRFLAFKAEAENSIQQADENALPMTVALRVETVAVFLKALMNSAMSPENGEFLKQVQSSCLQVFPRLMNSTNVNRDPTDSNSFAKDVEKEVEFYYGRLYEGDMSISSFIEMLQSLKRSVDMRDQDVFACMLHSLFDEYRFFADYPISALSITAVLFGSLIQNQLLSYIPLGIALRYILDAVAYDSTSNMFKFGVQALNHFKKRVPDWPQYCQQILAISSLSENEPELVHSIRILEGNSARRAYEPEDSRTSILVLPEPHTSGRIFRSLRAGPALHDPDFYSEPSVEETDKILFNMNNLSLTNLSEKLDEVKSVLREEHFAWFATHLVAQRAAIEPNYHSLYIHFLEAMQNEQLIDGIVHETIQNISLLLNAESTITSTVERTNLKNLGSWLGGLTLARNKPLKHKSISLKDLLLEGFDESRLLVVLPFVCRVLEQISTSKVFRPPNPWTMAVLGLLLELYENADMKLNLKFEVEVLCKKLFLQMSDIPLTTVLQNRPVVPESNGVLEQAIDNLQLREENTALPSNEMSSDPNVGFVSTAIAELPITIHPLISQNFAVPNLRGMVSMAAERAVRELILPVVERSVAVASISTSQLVSKDFAYEEDLSKLRHAAHTMNQNLAGSLALVTCKEPLRNAFAANMRVLLGQSGYEGLNAEGETLLAQLISDNLDVTCMIVEKAAMEKAVVEIDEGLASGYQIRRKHIETRSGQKFLDPSAPRHLFPLPDPLRLQASGLTLEQLATYEDFSRVPRTAQEAANYYAKEEARTLVSEQESTLYRTEQQSASAFEHLLDLVSEIDALARDSNAQTIDDVPMDKSLRTSLQAIPHFIANITGNLRDERLLTCAQRVCQLLFRTPFHELSAQCLTFILSSFIEVSIKTYRDVIIWLIHAEDPRKFNVPVIEMLIKAQIIIAADFDVQLSKQLGISKSPALKFSLEMLLDVVLAPSSVAFRSDFLSCLDSLHAIKQSEDDFDPDISPLFHRMDLSDVGLNGTSTSFDVHILRDQMNVIFMEWLHLNGHPASNGRLRLAYILQLQDSGIMADEDLLCLFFRCGLEQCFESAMRLPSTSLQGSTPAHYAVVDATARLVVLMLTHADSDDEHSTIQNLKRFLDVAVLVFVSDKDVLDTGLAQKPMFRLMSSIVSEIHLHASALQAIMSDLLLTICDTLDVLQPSHVPSFTFGWITLLSHRLFMPNLLTSCRERTWPAFCRLLTKLLDNIALSLGSERLSVNTRLIYDALLRLLLVLLNDFPSFLDEYHYTLMNHIPYGCVQLRNLILSSFPPKMLLPDPFLPGLKVDRLPESAHAPRICADLEQVLSTGKVLNHVHNYIYSLNSITIAKISKALLKGIDDEDENHIDVVLLNTLILHCGVQAMGIAKSPPVFEVNSPWVSLLHELFRYLGPTGRYKMLSAIANQLRYPNSHTYFFSCVLLLLFSNGSEQDALIKEQITRVLLERLICNRPHPWGLLITFTELLKNSKYGFWDLKFIRTSPEIETLFHSLFNHINQNISQSI